MCTKLPEDYEIVFDFAAIGMALLSLEGEFLRVNAYFCQFFGYDPIELSKLLFSKLVHPEDIGLGFQEIQKLLSGEIPTCHLENRFVHKTGEIKWGLSSVSLVRDEMGIPLYSIVQIQDITARKRVEDNLSYRVEFERFVTTLSTGFINCPVDKIDEEITSALEKIGKFLRVDCIFVDQFYEEGRKYKKVMEWNPPGITPFLTQELTVEAVPGWYRKLSEKDGFYYEEKEQNLKAQLLLNIPITQAGENVGFIGVASHQGQSFSEEDIRLIKVVGEVIFSAIQRKQAEIARRNSEQLIAAAFAASPALMMILSMEGKGVIDVNDTFIEVLGYDRSELLNKQSGELSELIRQSDYEHIYETLNQHGTILNREIELITKSGIKRTCLFSAEKIMIGKEMCLLLVSQDITEKKCLEKEMARLERLDLIGQMAAGIGHEIRNPMTTVRGYLQYISKKDKYADEIETFQLMIEELDRANEIITEYLSLSQDRVVDFKRINLNTIIQHLYPILSVHTKMEDKSIELNLGSLPELYLDKKELCQLILNLVRNGLEAMPIKGKLTISTYIQQGNVILEVEDQGRGIPNEIKDKVGTPFFTTKLNGTGLGMAICYSIAERHNALIDLQSGPQGTKVRVKFQGAEEVKA
ncbi:Adaptive-response sensory-kinase SasA [bioreactor metagenome]|uniref:histidine kinase n=2 Tax=root TaxID=1 RepID=A0A098B7J3_DESHA|nr:PAS domain S-box protein [Desulfitobacterium hafniense]MEA5021908.1 PAS domain S-box protein [Desulfitobacterium hafniense]CDX04337.1 Sensor protein ZraS [Desulfitobacterium hafniense]